MDEMRTLLADTCTRLFTDRVTPALIESTEKGQWPDDLWQAVEEGGLTLPQIPETHGGAGGTWDHAQVVLSAAGRFAVPLPIAETMLGAWLLASSGLDVPMGPITVAPTQAGERLSISRNGGGWALSGTAARVPWGRSAKHVVALAESGGKLMVARVAGGAAKVEPDTNLALEPRDTLTWSNAAVAAAGASDSLQPDSLWLGGALARSAQMAGGLEFLLSQSVKYVSERKQFGKPLSTFQVIQQNLALLAGHTAAAGMAAQAAFHAMEKGDAAFEIACAKIRVGEAAGLGAGIAHQAHGAIGFTYEHTLHFVTRRLWSWRAEFGAEGHWAERLGREVAARGSQALWPMLTAR
ncbi:MAG TPA: acyl-CoA dehydrogenase family protein [Methylomirabilota bacterium]|nr:acyl-CoA dehydrogenase family protein [Methylomirabilota bacterium]